MSKTIKIRKKAMNAHTEVVAYPTQSVKVKIKGANKGAKDKVEILVGENSFDIQVGKSGIHTYTFNPVDDSRVMYTRDLILTILEDWTGEDDVVPSDRLSELDNKPKKLIMGVIAYLENKFGSEFGIPSQVVKDVSKESVDSFISLIENLEGIPETWEYNPDQDHLDLVTADVQKLLAKVALVTPDSTDKVYDLLSEEEIINFEKKLDKHYDIGKLVDEHTTFDAIYRAANEAVIQDEVDDADNE